MSATQQPLMKLRLRMIAEVDFRHGIPHHYDELHRRGLLEDFGDRDVVLLISVAKVNLAFVFNEYKIVSRGGFDTRAIGFYRIQLNRHTPWNPTMLSEYAKEAGIELDGVRKFGKWIKDQAE